MQRLPRYLAFLFVSFCTTRDPLSRVHRNGHAATVKVLRDLVASQSFYIVEHSGRVQGSTARQDMKVASAMWPISARLLLRRKHGDGLARSIIETAISRLHSEGVMRIELMLEADNPRALSFYRKLGFQLEGTMRCAYKRASDRALRG